MDWLGMILTVLGLCVFETISSLDNAVVNADVLSTMSQKARRWFLTWGLFFAVFLVRGMLPWLLVWFSNFDLGPIGSLTATFRSDPMVEESLKKSSPLLLNAGGVFLILLFLHWLFLEEKQFGLPGEKFIQKNGIWFYAFSSLFLAYIIWMSLKQNPMLAFAASIGSSAFFITHGFKEQAQQAEVALKGSSNGLSEMSKNLYLIVLDATFSIDGVIGAFAFTMSVPLIVIGNGLGAYVVREVTLRGVDKIRNYPYLKNGAMYSIGFLGAIMLVDAFGHHIPEFVAPVLTMVIIGFFLWKSIRAAQQSS